MEISIVISLLLLLVGVLNYGNTIAASIQSRKLTFAIMESLGMSGTLDRVLKLLVREGMLYAFFSIAVTVTAGTLITYICFQAVNYTGIPLFSSGAALAMQRSAGPDPMCGSSLTFLQKASEESFYCGTVTGV